MSLDAMTVTVLPIRRDNLVWMFPTGEQRVAVVDPGEAEPVADHLKRHELAVSHILITHHHGDHQGGAEALRQQFGGLLVGAARDAHRLPALDLPVRDGDRITLGTCEAEVFETPGHTLGHVVYRVGEALFTGDTLFSYGCGRLFEGTASQLWNSLQRLASLDGDPWVFPGHEYTLLNLEFLTHTLYAHDPTYMELTRQVRALIHQGSLTLPVPMSRERRANPFLRCHLPEVAALVGMSGHAGEDVFATLRALRNQG